MSAMMARPRSSVRSASGSSIFPPSHIGTKNTPFEFVAYVVKFSSYFLIFAAIIENRPTCLAPIRLSRLINQAAALCMSAISHEAVLALQCQADTTSKRTSGSNSTSNSTTVNRLNSAKRPLYDRCEATISAASFHPTIRSKRRSGSTCSADPFFTNHSCLPPVFLRSAPAAAPGLMRPWR